MKRINLVKYGFVRNPEEDFSDDGNRFQCYKVGKNIRVSKLVSDGCAYISASIAKNKLTYDEYSVLPHYNSLDVLNGVDISSINEEDLINLYNNCLEYEKEYEEAEKNSVFPTREELINLYSEIKAIRQNELEIIKDRLTLDKLSNLNEYSARSVLNHYKSLKNSANVDVNKQADGILNTSYNKNFCKNKDYYKEPSYDYKYILEILKED